MLDRVDFQFLLDQLDRGDILVAESGTGLPTIHQIPGAQHLGFGYFQAQVGGCSVQFEGGGAMQRTPGGSGWCFLVRRGNLDDFPYNRDGVRACLQDLIRDGNPNASRA